MKTEQIVCIGAMDVWKKHSRYYLRDNIQQLNPINIEDGPLWLCQCRAGLFVVVVTVFE